MRTTRLVPVVLLFAAAFGFTASAKAAVTFDWATVGNPGNAGDVQPQGTFGAVDYTYRISKHEVTNAQYTEFLNAVASTDTNGLYNTLMDSNTLGGITRSGTSGSYTYSVKAPASGQGPAGSDYTYDERPVVYVSFFDAMRFVNWLENGKPTGVQASGTTEDGVYLISDGLSEVRAPNATYFIPTENEWYKAAYYDPSGVYYDYPTATNSVPNNNLPSADTGNSANFYDSGYATGDDLYPLTEVGAYFLSESPYGTYDQGGNVWEMNEAVISSSLRGLRGGGWYSFSPNLDASLRESIAPFIEVDGSVGFRVARVAPEPSTAMLGAFACVVLLRIARRHPMVMYAEKTRPVSL